MRLVSPVLLPGLLFSLACDPQVDAYYRGEPLANVSVRLLEQDGRTTPRTLELGLVWVTRGNAELVRLDAVHDAIAGRYDARIFDPPAADSLLDCDASKVGFAWIVAARPGALDRGEAPLADAIAMRTAGEIVGWSGDHVLAYVEGEVSEGSQAAKLLGAPLPRGIHAMAGQRELHASSTREEVLIRVDGESAIWTPFLPPDRCDATPAPIRVDEVPTAPAGMKSAPATHSTGAQHVGVSTPSNTAGSAVDPFGRNSDPGGLR